MLDTRLLRPAKIFFMAGLYFALNSLTAAEYFVNQKLGSDKNDGSKNAPFKTIQAAANIAKAGSMLRVLHAMK